MKGDICIRLRTNIHKLVKENNIFKKKKKKENVINYHSLKCTNYQCYCVAFLSFLLPLFACLLLVFCYCDCWPLVCFRCFFPPSYSFIAGLDTTTSILCVRVFFWLELLYHLALCSCVCLYHHFNYLIINFSIIYYTLLTILFCLLVSTKFSAISISIAILNLSYIFRMPFSFMVHRF